ncbi:MAG TPA: hypothetical protein VFA22_11900 [Stellaceae bacterium]|nr:hypothetical protein [Stellaceae bacterium]
MALADVPDRARRIARCLVFSNGRMAEQIALATAALLLQQGQIDYAELWQQVALFASNLLT